MIVTMAASSNPGTLQWLAKDFLLETMDWINVMTYDYTGDWTDYAGHHSPLFASSKQPGEQNRRSTASTMKYLVEERGLPPIGWRSAFRSMAVASPSQEPYASTKNANKDRVPRGDYATSTASSTSKHWTRHWDDETKNPWLIRARQHGRHRLRRRPNRSPSRPNGP